LIAFGFIAVVAFYASARFIYNKTRRANAENYRTEINVQTERAMVQDKLEGGTLAE